jgi:ribosomal protein L7/L12
MSDSAPFLGIDFGTSKSSMCWFNPRSGQAEVIKNAEGEDKTPSIVYFGEKEVLVGTPAERLLQDEKERGRVFISVKRDLARATRFSLPGGRRVSPVDVAAEVLRKLKRDAEAGHFHEPVERAVITCPAAFSQLERDKIEQAARAAGFKEIRLLAEPVAAALAYARAGLKVGRTVLVYDLGGGTFDLALLAREEAADSFRLGMEPKGVARCGGDDFDWALYEHCDEAAQQTLRRAISLDSGGDLGFLRECRLAKEALSVRDRYSFRCYLSGGALFEHALDRPTLEGLVRPHFEMTVRLTRSLVEEAGRQQLTVETVVLIGGSSRVPLASRLLKEALPVEPQEWQHRDLAVALGAAWYANSLWGKSTPSVGTAKAAAAAGSEVPQARSEDSVVLTNQLQRLEEEAARARAEAERLQQEKAATEQQSRDAQCRELKRTLAAQLSAGTLVDALRTAVAALRLKPEDGETAKVRAFLVDRLGPLCECRRFAGHQSTVSSAAFSPDGRHILSGDRAGAVRLWSVESGQESACCAAPQKGVTAVAFAPDGCSIAVGREDGQIDLQDGKSLTTLRSLKHGGWFFDYAVCGLAFLPDGRHLLSAGKDCTVRLWDVTTGSEARRLANPQYQSGEFYSMALSPDGKQILTGSKDGIVRLWSVESGQEVRGLAGHQGAVWYVAYLPDGQAFSVGADGTHRTWDLESGLAVRQFSREWRRLPISPNVVAFNVVNCSQISAATALAPDGQRLLGTDTEGTLCVWDAGTGNKVRELVKGHLGEHQCLAFSADGRHALSAGGVFRNDSGAWRHTDTFVRLWGDSEQPASGPGQQAAAGSASAASADKPPEKTRFTVSLHGFDAGKKINVLKAVRQITGLGLPAAVDLLAHVPSLIKENVAEDAAKALVKKLEEAGGGVSLKALGPVSEMADPAGATRPGPSAVCVKAPGSVSECGRLVGHTDMVYSVAISPDGRRAISGGRDETLRLWDLETGAELRRIAMPRDTWEAFCRELEEDRELNRYVYAEQPFVYSVAFTPDGRRAACGLGDQNVLFWDVETGERVTRIMPGRDKGPVRCIALSPDGQYLLATTHDRVSLYGLQDHKEWFLAWRHSLHSLSLAVAFSPDGQRAVSAWDDGHLLVHEVASRQESHHFQMPGGTASNADELARGLAVAPDGHSLLSGAADGALWFWDLKGGSQPRRFLGHTGAVCCVAFAPDGRRALSGSRDATLRLWDVATGQEVYCLRGHEAAVSSVAITPDGRAFSGSLDKTLRLWQLPGTTP